MVARGGLEPPTQGFSVPVSKNPQKLNLKLYKCLLKFFLNY